VNKEKQCQVSVCPPGQWGAFQPHQCTKKAVVTRDGKRYCKIHDPEYIKKKDIEREARRAKCPLCLQHSEPWWSYCPVCGTELLKEATK